MHKGYYEAVLQLRNLNDEVFDFVCRQINKEKALVAKQESVKGGIDIYFASQKIAKKIGKELLESFGGEFKINAELYSRDRQTSKPVYRVSVLFRCFGFLKGEVIKVKGKIFKVTGIGKKVTGLNLETGKKGAIDYKDKIEKLEIKKTIVSKVKPALEVIHPETFQSVPVANHKKLKQGEKVKVVVAEKVYLV